MAALLRSGAKGAMKGGSAWQVGPLRTLDGTSADGQPIRVSVQVGRGLGEEPAGCSCACHDRP
jgi:hypothetical protein